MGTLQKFPGHLYSYTESQYQLSKIFRSPIQSHGVHNLRPGCPSRLAPISIIVHLTNSNICKSWVGLLFFAVTSFFASIKVAVELSPLRGFDIHAKCRNRPEFFLLKSFSALFDGRPMNVVWSHKGLSTSILAWSPISAMVAPNCSGGQLLGQVSQLVLLHLAWDLALSSFFNRCLFCRQLENSLGLSI